MQYDYGSLPHYAQVTENGYIGGHRNTDYFGIFWSDVHPQPYKQPTLYQVGPFVYYYY